MRAMIILMVALTLGGWGLVLTAIWLLAGPAWAMLASGLGMILAAAAVRAGLKSNG